MPLAEHVPTIDDRRFNELVSELRTRVPRYAPEWTDLNDNDPGIALAQLFAWLTDMLLFRVDQIPRRNQIAFLRLLGIELRPATPATASIVFPVLSTYPELVVDVPSRTQVSASGAPGDPPVIFETVRSLVAVRAALAAVVRFDGYSNMPVTAQNEAVQPFEPFGATAGAGAALLLGFRDPGLFPRVSLPLTVWAVEGRADAPRVTCGGPSAFFPPVELTWEGWSQSRWIPLQVLKDETVALTRSGTVTLRTPDPGVLTRSLQGGVTESLYWLRGRIVAGAYERPPELTAVRVNTVVAEQAVTVSDEVLGGSNGRPDQQFLLANTPVVAGSLEIVVQEDRDWVPFTEVADFLDSRPDSRHFVLNRTTGEVRFGNGVRGMIPFTSPGNRTGNIVARAYRFGGGAEGNVEAGTVTSILTPVAGLDENAITNLQGAAGGQDEEALDDVIERAPRTITSKCRAVTVDDFEHLAQETGNVQRAKALPGFHPAFPGIAIPGVVTVVIVPDSKEREPMPSEGTLRTVCAYLDQRRLLTTEVYVVKPTYRRVEAVIDVVVADGADLGEVRQAVEETLLTYFHPLRGGEDGRGWPFGGDIFFSRVFHRVQVTAGVERVEQVVLIVDGDVAPVCTDIAVPDGVLLTSVAHEVRVRYGDEE